MARTQTASLTLRLDPDLHRAFLAACSARDRSAAQEVRAFMRAYVAAHAQGELPLSDALPGLSGKRRGGGSR